MSIVAGKSVHRLSGIVPRGRPAPLPPPGRSMVNYAARRAAGIHPHRGTDMRGNTRKWTAMGLAAVLALGLAPAVAIAAVPDGTQATESGSGGIRFGIEREEYEAQARAAMQVDPVVAAHIGAIRAVALDEPASLDEPGPDVLVFDIEGSRGKGRVTARFITVSASEEALGPGTLVMADGTRHAIEGNAEALAADAEDASRTDDGSLLAQGQDIFSRQAREAAQRYPLVQQHIGRIERFVIDPMGTGAAPGRNTFVFDLAGSKGNGKLEADFITVDADTERLGKGVLTLADGRRLPFEGEPPGPGETSGADEDDFSSLFGSLQDNLFTRQAREAVQRYPLVQQYIGTLDRFDLDMAGTGEAEGANEFAFDIAGDKGSGRIVADFITVDADTERLGTGVLTLADGRELRFEGEAPHPGEGRRDAGEIPDTFATQGGMFVLQANAAMQAHPVVQRYIGDIREAAFDREASWTLPGDRYAFDLKGSKGSGRLVADFITVDADNERIGDGELVMADGTRHALAE